MSATPRLGRAEAVSRFLTLAPDFAERWQAYQADWSRDGGEPPGACLDFAEFGDFVHESILAERPIDLPAIFTFIETCLLTGDDDVQAGASTCFLENLQNMETPPAVWVPHLGPDSIAFCKAWDAFTRVYTPGLW